MIKSSSAYKNAIKGDARKIYIKAAVDITDPDIQHGEIKASEEASISKKEELINKQIKFSNNYITLEKNRWLLNGNSSAVSCVAESNTEIGYVSSEASNLSGYFEDPIYIRVNFANVSVLQGLTISFSDEVNDGYATDFSVLIKSGNESLYMQNVEGNKEPFCVFENFTVNNPTAIELTITRWSQANRRARVVEIVPGFYEEWTNNDLVGFDVTQQIDVSNMSTRYGTATLKIDNEKRKFSPRNKVGIFKSIEERQGIELSIGVRLEDGSVDFKRIGTFYQHEGKWKTADNGLTVTWQLVDIIGLLSNREFIVPDTMPTTLEGWVKAVMAQLGENFKNLYYVDPEFANKEVFAYSPNNIASRSCGDVLRYACMASGAWAKADALEGCLAIGPLKNEGNELDLDNLTSFPSIKGNNDVASLVFNVYTGNETTQQIIIPGSNAAAENTASIENPFIHTEEDVLLAANSILLGYGGNEIEATGRGDPSSEIGDVDGVWISRDELALGRRIKQSFTIRNGVMTNCKSVFLELKDVDSYGH